MRRSPTVRRRRLGFELRRLREQSGLTIDVVAGRIGCSTSKISRIETGHTGVTPHDVRTLLDIYQVTGAEGEELVQIARDARKKGWWHPYSTVLTSAFVGLETEAASIQAYEQQVVPGLLQTEEYARALLRAARPDITAAEVERRVLVRMHRQSLLGEVDAVDLWVVLDEAVLSRPVGGDEVMRRQLRALARAGELSSVTVQVLPFHVGAHPGMDGTFTILNFSDLADTSVVFAENATGGLFLEKTEELNKYRTIFQHICAAALPPEESVALIASLAREPLWKSRPRGTGWT